MNYQIELEKILEKEKDTVKSLVLHSCCAPCSSYVIEYLSKYFNITVFYYNPNIYPDDEYFKRVIEQQRFIERFPAVNPVKFIEGSFDKERFYDMANGKESLPEGGERCRLCYELRLRETAVAAKNVSADFFATTLTISPLKNAEILNKIGYSLEAEYGVRYLPSDFKKKNGFKRSAELSREYGIYRQDYCGCVFSKAEREKNQNNE